MRLPALALALLALAPAVGGALPLPAVPLPLLRDAGGAADGAPPLEGPGVRVVVENRGAEGEVWLRVEDGAGRVVANETLRVGPGREVVLEAPLPPEEQFQVRIVARPTRPLGPRTESGAGANLAGCDGPYRMGWWIQDGTLGTTAQGCLVPPPDFASLVAEARAALRAPRGGEAIRVPLPGLGDEGNYSGFAFRWGTGRALGPHGEVREGPVATWAFMFPSQVHGWGVSVEPPGAPPVRTSEQQVEVRDLRHELHLDAAGRPWAHTVGVTIPGQFTGTSSTVGIVEELAFGPPARGLSCYLRHGLQGRELRPGDRVPALELCVAGPEAARGTWVAGAPQEVRGFRTLPLHLLVEDGPRTLAAKALLADGLAYPLGARVVAWAPGEVAYQGGFGALSGLRSEGSPIPSGGPAAEAPRPTALAPLDALRGPSRGAGEGLPFPLDEAVDAVLAHPLPLRAHGPARAPGGALVAALLDARRAADGSPDEVEWLLAFAAPGTPPAWAVCTRPLAAAALPVARCADALLPPHGMDLPGGADAAQLPRQAAAWSSAVALWRAHGGEGPATHARYFPLGAPRDWDAPPWLSAGRHFAGRSATVLPSEAERADYAALDLATGAPLLVGRGAARAAGLGGVADGIAPPAPFRPSGAGPLVGDLPPLLAVGAAVSLLALLAALAAKGGLGALYTRLAKPRLLEQEARARAYALVRERPGIHAREVARALGSAGNADYHLGVLEREGFVSSVRTEGFRRYFLTGRLPPARMRTEAVLLQGRAALARDAIAAAPGLGVVQLARTLGVQPPAASKVVDRLERAGLVERRREGKVVRLFPRDPQA